MRFNSEIALFLIRDELFEVADEPVIGALIFGAMERGRLMDLPTDPSELARFADGPLREVIEAKLGAEQAERVVHAIRSRIAEDVWQQTQEASTKRTKKLDVGEGPLRVVVLSHQPLAVWVRAALAEDFVDVRSLATTADPSALVERLHPSVVVVDATEEGLREPAKAVASWLGAIETSRVVWGTGGAWSSELRSTLDRLEVDYVPVDRREGVEPLLDLLRSYATGAHRY